MSFEERTLQEKDLISLFQIEENHFNDFKAKDIEGKKIESDNFGICKCKWG